MFLMLFGWKITDPAAMMTFCFAVLLYFLLFICSGTSLGVGMVSFLNLAIERTGIGRIDEETCERMTGSVTFKQVSPC
jgi:hypothetical protein